MMRSLRSQFSHLQAGLGPPRSRRTVPPQRRPPEPAAEGRHRLPRQRHHREPRRQGKAARNSGSAHRGLSRTRAASLRWRGPFLSRFNRRRTMLTLVRRQPQQPRALRAALVAACAASAVRLAALAAGATVRHPRHPPVHCASHKCIGHCANLRALPVAMLPVLVRALLRSSARTSLVTASRSLLRPAVRSIATAAPPRVPRRCRFPHRSYSRIHGFDRPGRLWVPHPTHR